jgi:hypothetical protein
LAPIWYYFFILVKNVRRQFVIKRVQFNKNLEVEKKRRKTKVRGIHYIQLESKRSQQGACDLSSALGPHNDRPNEP